MTIGSAKQFIERGMVESDLRKSCNKAKSIDELDSILNKNEFSFSYDEFDEAFNNLHSECQFEDRADQIKEFKTWWDMLTGLLAGSSGAEAKSADSSDCASSGACSSCSGCS